MELQNFVRRSFAVKAVRVTKENIWELAEWCGGTVTDIHGDIHIKVDVKRPLNEKQTQAHVGDWVLNTKKGFKVYNEKAFHANFRGADQSISDGVEPFNLKKAGGNIISFDITRFSPTQD